MKLYIKTRNKFLRISILILIIALIVIFKFNNGTLGNFLLGIFASTFIITIQYDLSSKVEESKLLIDKLKKISDICFDFNEFNTFSVDHFAVNFEKKLHIFKNKIEYIFNLNDQLGNIKDLNIKTKKDLNTIIQKIGDLETNLYFIFKDFDQQNKKMKIIYFMEFYHIIKEFNFEALDKMVTNLGCKIDSEEYFKRNYKEKKTTKFQYLKYKTSIQIYNTQLEEKHAIEYKALKNQFEKFMK